MPESIIEHKEAIHEGHVSVAAQVKKSKKGKLNKNLIFLSVGVVVLLVLIWFFAFFLPNHYRFSFTIQSVNYYSNDYTPSEFFSSFRDNNKFIVSVDLVDGNADPWAVNSMNLWLVALKSDNKQAYTLIKTVDGVGNIQSCLTNDNNVLSSRKLSGSECGAMLNDPSFYKVVLHTGGGAKAILSNGQLDTFGDRGEAETIVNYSVIKNIYKDFDKTLAIINEKINSVQ